MPANNDSTVLSGGSPAPEHKPGDSTRIDGYEMLGKLGSGAMGEVYRAKHVTSGQEVAIKVMGRDVSDNPDLVKRFEREIELLTKLDHPNIAKAIGHGVHGGRVYLAMEFVRGPTLAALLKAQGPFPEIDVLRLVVQIAKALEYVHSTAKLIHRDIKPANILVIPAEDPTAGDMVKIIDFGLARTTTVEDHSLTLTGMVMGTPYYISPEQIRGEKELTVNTDIYALGATMYHLLTGTVPYDGNSPVVIMTGHLQGKIPDPGALVPSLSPATRHLVMTSMAKKPSQRYLNYQGVIRACESAMKTLAIKNTAGIKLLRKPMVVTERVTRRKPPPPLKADDSGTIIDPFAHELPSRVRKIDEETDRKARIRVEASNSGTDRMVRSAAENGYDLVEQVLGGQEANASISGSEALRRVHTDKIRRIQTTAKVRRQAEDQLDVGVPEVLPPAPESAVFVKESRGVRDMLQVPLLLLALAIFSVLGYWLLTR